MEKLDNIIYLLENKYKSFINEKDDYNFLVGLADYVEFIESEYHTKNFLNKLKKDINKIIKIEDRLREKALKELEDILKKIKKIIIQEKLNSKDNLLNLNNINFYIERDFTPIYVILEKEFNSLKNNKKLFKKYPILKKDFSFLTKNFQKYKIGILNILEQKMNTLWFCYERLFLINRAILHEEYFEKLKISSIEFLRFLDISTAIMLIQRLNSRNIPEDFLEKFGIEKRSDLNLYVKRIHNYLIEKLINKMQKNQNDNRKSDRIILFLDKNGDLYIEPKNKYCYSMKNTSNLYKILSFFTKNNIYKYYSTEKIMNELELLTSKSNFMKDIGKINRRIRSIFKIKDKIIEGRKGSGYRINPKYKIKLT